MNAERYLLICGAGPASTVVSDVAEFFAGSSLQRRDWGSDVTLFAPPDLAIAQMGACLVIGQMPHAPPALPSHSQTPDRLVEQSWGSYVSLGLCAERKARWVLRAPLGHLPAYHVARNGAQIIGSHPELILTAIGEPAGLDWTFVARHLAYPHLHTARTGIAQITELLGGECLECGINGSWDRRQVWSPWTWTEQHREISKPAEARRELRASVERAVAGLVPHDVRCLLELSGGLDSSILAATLSSANANARAVTLVTDGREGDERIYARAVADVTGLPLEEVAVAATVDLARPASVRSARPGLPMTLSLADERLAETALAANIAAFVSGAGGDCVFCSPGSAAPAADVLRRFGVGRKAWTAIDALARIHHASVWDVAKMAWREGRKRAVQTQWPRIDGFLAQQAQPAAAPVHPWLEEPAGVLPGKRSHVRAILAALAHVEGYGRHRLAPSRFPLLSQPVVETALRIPSWLWIEHGRDRAVARSAWRSTLPSSVLDRRTKGGLDSYAIAVLARNRNVLGSFLLEGHVSRSGLIDRPKLESALKRTARRGDGDIYSLFPLIDTEAWARAWLGEP